MSSFAYENSLASYNSLVDAYAQSTGQMLNQSQLKDLSKEVEQQSFQAVGLGAGLPLSLEISKTFSKTKGGTILLQRLGRKFGMTDEDMSRLMKDPKQALADLLDKKLTRQPAEAVPEATEEETEMPETDFETFNVEFPEFGTVQTTRTFGRGVRNLVESHFEQREPVHFRESEQSTRPQAELEESEAPFGRFRESEEEEEQFYDARDMPSEVEMQDVASGVERPSTTTFSQSEAPMHETQVQRHILDEDPEASGDVAEEGETTGETVGEEIGETTGETTGEEVVGSLLDSTGILAPIGILVGIVGALGSIFGGLFDHHHHDKPPPPPNWSIPSAQMGV